MAIGNLVMRDWPSAFRDAEVANNVVAAADIAAGLAGRARQLYEHATGGPATATEPVAITQNPQGLWGHDHSGPPYGSCFKHPVFYFSGDTTAAGWSRSTNIFIIEPTKPKLTLRALIWERPFAPVPLTPYSRLVVMVRCRASAALQTVGVGLTTNDGAKNSEDIVVGTATTNFTLDGVLHLEPGYNDVAIELSYEGAHLVEIMCISGLQVVKRSH